MRRTHGERARFALAAAALPALAGCGGSAPPDPSPSVGGKPAASCAAATLTLTPDRGAPGDRVRVVGGGYVVCEDAPTGSAGADPVAAVDLHWIQDGATVKVGEADVADDGTLGGSFTVPADAAAEAAEVWAGDGLQVGSESAAFTIVE